MQELDTLLNDYLDAYYTGLDEPAKDALEQLLDTEDDTLWLWLSGQKACENLAFTHLINDIRR